MPHSRTAGRPNKLSDPAFAQAVAELLADGLTRQQVMDKLEELNLAVVKDPQTISRWKRDPRVKGILTKLINERVQEVTRKVDSKIAAILERDDLTVQELILIRKEYLGGALRAQTEKADQDTVEEAMKAAEDPDFQRKLADLFASKS
jgi:hypothetical protein